MKCSGRRASKALLPLFLFATACTKPVVYVEEVAEVETCERLVPVGIELVNDYVYTLEETDLGPTGGDPDKLPASLIALNARGEDLDRRAAELDCDVVELNAAVAEATAGLESSDPVVQALLETVRSGVVAIPGGGALPGEWVFVEGASDGAAIEPAPGQAITLTIDETGVASGSTGCGEYDRIGSAEGGLWYNEALEQTAGACPSAAYAQAEDAYVVALSAVEGYVVEGDDLVLSGPGVELTYSRVSDLAGD